MSAISYPTRSKSSLNILEFGDVHLGHHRTKTPEILNFLFSLLPETQATRELDLIIIAGDLFDRLLYNNDIYNGDITIWMVWLLRQCEKHDIVLRVLEGTPSHDREQSKRFVDLHTAIESTADFRYVNELEYEYHEKLGISILYLPDEWNNDLTYSFNAAKLLLAERGVQKADIAIMHGAFDYQFPPNVQEHVHNSDLWQSIIEYLIFIGHVHTRSQKGKILAAGSVDRLKHGEEEDKGALRVVLDFNHQHKIDFIVNPFAKQFKTIDCRGLETDSAIELVTKITLDTPEGSYLRIWANSDDNIANGDVYLRAEYPQFHWDFKIESNDLAALKSESLGFDDDFVPVDLNAKSLPGLLEQRLIAKGYAPELITRVLSKYKEAA